LQFELKEIRKREEDEEIERRRQEEAARLAAAQKTPSPDEPPSDKFDEGDGHETYSEGESQHTTSRKSEVAGQFVLRSFLRFFD